MILDQYYLEILRYPHLRDNFKKAYISDLSHPVASVLPLDTSDSSQDMAIVSPEDHTDIPAASQHSSITVTPMKAALYFDSAEGFGAWRILISPGTDTELRLARKKNPSFLKAIIKTLKCVCNSESEVFLTNSSQGSLACEMVARKL